MEPLVRGGLTACIVVALISPRLPAQPVVFVEAASEWKYLPGVAEASSPDPEAWRLPGFDDAGWASGPAPFGYGITGLGTDLAQREPPMRGNYTSLFLRRSFNVADRERVGGLRALVKYDDGFILWINGREVASSNVPSIDGEFVPHDALATRSHTASAFEEFALEGHASFLASGRNTIAAQVFNITLANNDLFFDLELIDPFGPDLRPPRLARVIPLPGTTVRQLAAIELAFDEPVAGVDAADLLINGRPGSAVSGEGAGPYIFTFPEPAPGPVSISWRAGHGIIDLAPDRNVFAAEGWSYHLDPDASPPRLAISEILAANGTGLRDEDGDAEDWIEILNHSADAVDLAGWSLSDERNKPGMWVFPSVLLRPGEALIVFASAKNRTDPAGRLHTNFKLSEAGEYLGLFRPEIPRQSAFEFAPRFPPQRFDHSYGLTATGALRYFSKPTPGASNDAAESFAGFVREPVFSVERGIYEGEIELELWSPTAGAQIHYTLDGSPPLPATASLYTGPLRIAGLPDRGAVAVRAAATRQGLLPSTVVTHTYVFPESVLGQPARPEGFPASWPGTTADYALDPAVIAADPAMALRGLTSIPSLSIVTDVAHLFDARTGIYTNPSLSGPAWERPTSAELIYPDGSKGFQIDCGIRTQGGSSVSGWKSKKVSLRLAFRGDYGSKKLVFPLFPDYRVTRFDTLVLDASLNLVWNHPDASQQSQAQYVRDQFVADLENEAGGHAPRGIFVNLYLNGLYWGQYGIHERPDASFAAENFGGEKEEYDAIRHQPTNVVDGNAAAFLEMMRRGAVIRDANDYRALEEYLDIGDFARYMLINFYAGNTDWAHQNWYASRRRAAGFQFLFHSWDAEHVLKGVNDYRLDEGRGPAAVFQALRRYGEFQLLFADIAHRHFFNGGILHVDPDNPQWDPMHPERNRPFALYRRRIEEIDSSILMESARWGDVSRPGRSYTREDWLRELRRLETAWFPQRSRIVLSQLQGAGLYPRIPAPLFSRHGGEIEPGFVLGMSLPAGAGGTIYYTIDGVDPRHPGSGDAAPGARVYTGPLQLDDHTLVKARTRDESGWSALNEALFSLPRRFQDLFASEIMYNPPGGDAFEFLELHNAGSTTISLSGASFKNGIQYSFGQGAKLEAGGYLVLAGDAAAFAERYPGVPLAGVYRGNLANGGERLELASPSGETVLSLDYDDEGFWPLAADGLGRSLVLERLDGDLDDPRSWRASALPGGSPGAADPPPAAGGVLVSEVLAAPGAGGEAWVELHNTTTRPLPIGGWHLSDNREDARNLQKYRIPDGTVLPAGGRLAFTGSQLGGALRFSPAGGAIYLSSTAAGGGLGGHIAGLEYGPAPPGISFGVHETSLRLEVAAMAERTPGEPNSAPRVGAVVIHEIFYDPPRGGIEFLELHNSSRATVSLHDAALGRGWRVQGVRDLEELDSFEFAPGTVIPAGGYLLLAPVDPELFRATHAVPDDVAIVRYGGALDNSGERLQLLRPLAAAAGGIGWFTEDQVRYGVREPWPAGPAGNGASLERIEARSYGNEPLNWGASLAAGGTPGGPNSISLPPRGGLQLPGDADQDGRLTITDAVRLLRHLFGGGAGALPCAGDITAAGNLLLFDADGNGALNITDPIYLLRHLFAGGPPHAAGLVCVEVADCAESCR
jgi:hypothetical protein